MKYKNTFFYILTHFNGLKNHIQIYVFHKIYYLHNSGKIGFSKILKLKYVHTQFKKSIADTSSILHVISHILAIFYSEPKFKSIFKTFNLINGF